MDLSILDGTNGFQISGEAAGDYSGLSVSAAGDVNGDGFADLVIGAKDADPNGSSSGASYVVFGQAGGFGANLELSALAGANGFRISGETAGGRSGHSVSVAGDVNGDGFADLVIGAPFADPNGLHSGSSYVVFGQAGGFGANLELSALAGANGFRISGEAAGDYSGFSVSAAGDVNGDGFADLVIGAAGADSNWNSSGTSYVVFGQAGGFGANLELSALTGANGFQISGENTGGNSGRSVSAAGDVNGDGFADLVIGAPGADSSYVVFGQAGGFGANLNLSSLTGANGLQISGGTASSSFGKSVSGAGDVNGDGFDDLIIGGDVTYSFDGYGGVGGEIYHYSVTYGASYVVFGQAGGFGANLDASSLTGANGFRIRSETENDGFGQSVSAAGDVNGDGFADLIIGAPRAYPNGGGSGASYVVFGQASGFAAILYPSQLNGVNGFEINGEAAFDRSGSSVSAAGDVNGDGFDDLIIGAPYADPNGSGSGASYVVFGADFSGVVDSAGTVGNDNLTGDSNANVCVGGLGDDTLDGAGGADVLKGGGGDDRLIGGAGDDRLYGGVGLDTVSYESESAAVTVNLGLGTASGTSAGADLLNGVEGVVGSAFADTLTGDGRGNQLDGGAGDDTLTGGAGDDTYFVDSSADVVVEAPGEGTDTVVTTVGLTLPANVENIRYEGPAGGSVFGNALDNVVSSRNAGNTLGGGDGNDTVSYADETGPLTIDLQAGQATGTATDTLFDFENAVGGAAADSLVGTSGENRLDGNGGADTMTGGAGDDTYVVDDANDVVVETSNSIGGVIDTVVAEVSFSLANVAFVENLTLAAGAIAATGNTLNNVLTGNAGDNILNGGAGNDTMAGGTGDDTYFRNAAGDVMTELPGQGIDTVKSSTTYTLRANFENLTLTGGAAINATGNAVNNVLTGNAANNTLNGGAGNDTMAGGAGNDTMAGGAGNDTYVVNAAGDVVTEMAGQGTDTVQSAIACTLGAHLENLTLIGAVAINGTGNTLANVLAGNSGDNALDGSTGSDTASYANATSEVTVSLGVAGAQNTIGAGTDTLTAIENLTGSNFDDTLTGSTAANVLDGGTGNDTMDGGLGNDTYAVNVATDVVTEAASAGTDTVRSVVTYTLGLNLENLTLTGTAAINGTGNTLDNVLTGNAANNTLGGGSGNDTLDGGAGNDTMAGGAGNDLFIINDGTDSIAEAANAGTDTVQSAVSWMLGPNFENLVLTGAGNLNGIGNAGNNVLTGNAGANVLNGQGGSDALYGMNGNDTLTWNAAGTLFDGGVGTDTLKANAGNLNLVTIANTRILNVETINLTGTFGGNSLLTLNTQDVLDLSSTTNTLHVFGDPGDSINIVPGFSDLGVVSGFHKYTFGGAVLLVDTDITNVA